MNIYERIKELRLSQNMSQYDLALKVGYKGRSAISKVEKGERDISQSMIEKYAKALGVTPTYLLYGIDETKTPISDTTTSAEKKWINELIELYRSLPEDKKKQALDYLRYLSTLT